MLNLWSEGINHRTWTDKSQLKTQRTTNPQRQKHTLCTQNSNLSHQNAKGRVTQMEKKWWSQVLNWALASDATDGAWVCPIWGCAEKAWSQPLTSTLMNQTSLATETACCNELKGEAKTMSLANLVLPQHDTKSFSSKLNSILRLCFGQFYWNWNWTVFLWFVCGKRREEKSMWGCVSTESCSCNTNKKAT